MKDSDMSERDYNEVLGYDAENNPIYHNRNVWDVVDHVSLDGIPHGTILGVAAGPIPKDLDDDDIPYIKWKDGTQFDRVKATEVVNHHNQWLSLQVPRMYSLLRMVEDKERLEKDLKNKKEEVSHLEDAIVGKESDIDMHEDFVYEDEHRAFGKDYPKYNHNCSNCTFLGHYVPTDEDGDTWCGVDLYYHHPNIIVNDRWHRRVYDKNQENDSYEFQEAIRRLNKL